jgi:hypothetical protein
MINRRTLFWGGIATAASLSGCANPTVEDYVEQKPEPISMVLSMPGGFSQIVMEK